MFKVEGKCEEEFQYKTSNEVIEVVIDPDMNGYHYDQDQKKQTVEQARNRKVDASRLLKGQYNWSWFFTSYIQYMNGEYEKAISTLSTYFSDVMELENMSLEDLGKDYIRGPYVFTRAIYYLANKDENKAEADIKRAIPGIFNLLLSKDRLDIEIWASAGVLIETGDKGELVSLLELLTGKEFAWDDGLEKEEKKQKVEEWKHWWEKAGKNQKLNLEAVRTRYNIGT